MIYYDRAGQPIPGDQAFRLMGSDTERRVAETTVGDYWVSTIHLVIDHSFGRGAPVIFETMVFKGGSMIDEYAERYCTEEQAREGHENIVGMIRALEDVQ